MTGKKTPEIAQKVRGAALNGAAYLAVFLCLAFIVAGIAAAVFFVGVTRFPSVEGGTELPSVMTLTVGSSTNSRVRTENYTVDGVLYLNFSQIAELGSLSVSGEAGDLTFSTPSGEVLTLVTGNTTALMNGNIVRLGGTVLERDGAFWLPYDFLAGYLTGFDFRTGQNFKGQTYVSVTRNGEEIGYLLKSSAALGRIDLADVPARQRRQYTDTPIYEFVNDLSSFYPYMDPADRDEYLALSAPTSPTGADYVPADLVDVLVKTGSSGITLRLCAEKSLEALFIEMYAEGYVDVTVRTGFRSYDAQKSLYNRYFDSEKYYYRNNFATTGEYFSARAFAALGEEYLRAAYIDAGKTVLSDADAARVTKTYSAAPGTSDHQTGLGVDMHNLSVGSAAFAEQEAYGWLSDNAYKFGFIERYPADKVEVTGFTWEPHHWRFVGQYHAARMHETGMCLEEYVSWLAAQNNP